MLTLFSFVSNYCFILIPFRLKEGGELMEKVSVFGTSLLTLISESPMMTMGT